MRLFFQILMSMVFMPTMLLAAGGVTMQYNADEANLRDGDVFYADRHYRAPLDTIKKTINGLLGNSNIASDAKIVVTKLDSTGRISMDSVIANKGIRTTGVATVDSLKSTRGISATYGVFSGPVPVSDQITQTGAGSAITTQYSNTVPYVSSSASVSVPDCGYRLLSFNTAQVDNSAALFLYRIRPAAGLNSYVYQGAVAGTVNYKPSFVWGRATGAAAYTESMRLDGDGQLGIGKSPDATLSVNGSIAAAGVFRPDVIATPANPAASAMQFYFKGSKFILQYNDAGTQRWKYLDLSGTGVTWVYSATAP